LQGRLIYEESNFYGPGLSATIEPSCVALLYCNNSILQLLQQHVQSEEFLSLFNIEI